MTSAELPAGAAQPKALGSTVVSHNPKKKELVLGELKQGLSMWAHKIDYLEYLHYVDAKFLFLQEQILFWCRGEGKPWILRAVTDFWSGHALLWSSVKTNQNKGVVDVNVKTDPKTSECICRRALEVEMCRNYIIAKEQRQNGNKMCAAGSQSTCENIWTKSDKSIITLWMLLYYYCGRFCLISQSI